MQEAIQDTNRLPQPFDETAWSKALKPAVQALWRWHLSLKTPSHHAYAGADQQAFFEEESARAEAGQPLRILPRPVAEAAYAACRMHNLPLALLAEQACRLKRTAR